MLRAGARIHEDPDRDPRLVAFHDRLRVAIVLHEPHADVDRLRFGVDKVEQRRPAVLERRIAELIECVGAPRAAKHHENDESERGTDSGWNFPVDHGTHGPSSESNATLDGLPAVESLVIRLTSTCRLTRSGGGRPRKVRNSRTD